MIFGVLIVLAVAWHASALTPALQTTISPAAMNYVATFVLPSLVTDLRNAQVPNQSDNDNTPVGKVTIDLSNIHVTAASIASVNVAPASANALAITVSGMNLALSCNWHYRKDKWPHVSGGGSADISMSSAQISATLQLINNNGAPNVKCTSCTVQLGGFDIKVHGGASWLYNELIKLFKGKIENAVKNALDATGCATIESSLNAALSSLPLKEPIGQYLDVEYTLVNTPTANSAGLTLDSLGEFVAISMPMLDPCVGTNLPAPASSSAMMQFVLGQCALDSIGFALFEAKQLNILLTNDDLPASTPFHLTTNFFQFIIPQLYNDYPNRNLTAFVNAIAPPVVYFDGAGNIMLNSTANINMSVAATSKLPAVPVFTVQTALSVSVALSLNKTAIQPDMSFVNDESTVIFSAVGTGWESTVTNLLTASIQFVVLPYINSYLSNGFPLPSTPHVKLSNSSLRFAGDNMFIFTDFAIN